MKKRTRIFNGIPFYFANELASIGEARASASYWRRRNVLVRQIKVYHKNTGWTYEIWVSHIKRKREMVRK